MPKNQLKAKSNPLEAKSGPKSQTPEAKRSLGDEASTRGIATDLKESRDALPNDNGNCFLRKNSARIPIREIVTHATNFTTYIDLQPSPPHSRPHKRHDIPEVKARGPYSRGLELKPPTARGYIVEATSCCEQMHARKYGSRIDAVAAASRQITRMVKS